MLHRRFLNQGNHPPGVRCRKCCSPEFSSQPHPKNTHLRLACLVTERMCSMNKGGIRTQRYQKLHEMTILKESWPWCLRRTEQRFFAAWAKISTASGGSMKFHHTNFHDLDNIFKKIWIHQIMIFMIQLDGKI